MLELEQIAPRSHRTLEVFIEIPSKMVFNHGPTLIPTYYTVRHLFTAVEYAPVPKRSDDVEFCSKAIAVLNGIR